MPLTDATARTTKPQDKPFKLADGGGLYLLVKPDGARYWRLKYRYGGKEKLLAFGAYPEVSLRDTRERREEEARKLLAQGIDPGTHRQEQKEPPPSQRLPT
ncbi:hypothetical protein CCP3SC15_560021 [Gammaproteobacteria bacterium]